MVERSAGELARRARWKEVWISPPLERLTRKVFEQHFNPWSAWTRPVEHPASPLPVLDPKPEARRPHGRPAASQPRGVPGAQKRFGLGHEGDARRGDVDSKASCG